MSVVAAAEPAPKKLPEQTFLFHALWLPLMRFLAAIIFWLCGGFRAINKRAVPKTGGVLVLANHISDIDPPAVQFACARHIHFMAKSELFQMKLVGSVLRFFGAFPVKRGEPDRDSIRKAVELIKAGNAVGIFPEGQLSEDGKLQELKAGVALVIRMAACPVICCGLKNTDLVLPYGKLVPRPVFRKVVANWGDVHQFGKSEPPEQVLGWIEAELRRLSGQ